MARCGLKNHGSFTRVLVTTASSLFHLPLILFHLATAPSCHRLRSVPSSTANSRYPPPRRPFLSFPSLPPTLVVLALFCRYLLSSSPLPLTLMFLVLPLIFVVPMSTPILVMLPLATNFNCVCFFLPPIPVVRAPSCTFSFSCLFSIRQVLKDASSQDERQSD